MTKKNLDEIVALLKDGQHVEIDGLYFSAKRINQAFSVCPCYICNVDCLCRGNIARVCSELDFMSKTKWYLHLES